MKHLRLAALALVLLVPAVAGAQDRQADRDAFTWSGRIPDGRWIRVRNLNGAITVEPSNSDKVEVTATKRWRRGDPEAVRFEVQKFGTNDQDVVICALWGENQSCDEDGMHGRSSGNRSRHGRDVWVEFRVQLPPNVRVGAHTVNGDVRVDGAGSEVEAESVNGSVEVSSSGGPLHAETVNGSVRASMGHFALNTDLKFSSVNGSVVAEFADDVNAEVELSTVNGRFLTDFPVTISGRIDPKHLRAKIGNGGPRIQMETVNGNVELRKR